MQAYPLWFRQKVLACVAAGERKTCVAKRFGIGRDTVYRFADAEKRGELAPKESWGHWRKLDPGQLEEHIEARPDGTLAEMGEIFGVRPQTVWLCLRKLGYTRKKKRWRIWSETSLTAGFSNGISNRCPPAGPSFF
jgi:transposase